MSELLGKRRIAASELRGLDMPNAAEYVDAAYNRIAELESQLSAEREARQKAEAEALNWRNSYGNARTASLHWRDRAEAAEQRILASQEQEPFNGEEWELLAMELAREEHDDIHHLIYQGYPPEPWGEVWQRYEDDAKRIIELYRSHVQPIIPPEVSDK